MNGAMIDSRDQVESGHAVLEVCGLTVTYGPYVAVAGADLTIRRGEQVAIVGESGSGKTTVANAIGGFIDPLTGKVTTDRFNLGGRPVVRGKSGRLAHRTEGLSMVFQDAMSSLDPLWPIGSQLTAVLRRSRHLSRHQARQVAQDSLERLGIHDAERVLRLRPYEISGGMRQRVMLAIAFSSDPSLLIADEPTSALDAAVAVKAMELMVSMAQSQGTAMIMITHDLDLARRFVDRVVVMFQGKIVEEIAASNLDQAQHPYTRGLLECVPTLATAQRDLLPTLDQVMRDWEATA